jgi:rSAM/selenodomain-associated transferase 1
MSWPALIVIAKEPVPGRVKTRLTPPFTPAQAAGLAAAALADTLAAVAEAPVTRRVLALDGTPGTWLPPGFEVVPQVEGGLDRRLAGAFDAVGGPALLVGMDTPQLSPGLLARSLGRLAAPGVDAVLGPAPDGGYWAIGLRRAGARVFTGVPMSSAATASAQLARLDELGLRCEELEPLRDIDTEADARAVASLCPRSRFAAELARAAVPV